MKLKENIYNSINKMNTHELTLLYEQIKFLDSMKTAPLQKKKMLSIEQIHEMTHTSESCWSDSVVEGRADRI